MELTIKHLAAYLPYGVSAIDDDNVVCRISTLYDDLVCVEYEMNVGQYEKYFNEIKLILHPLSEFGDPDDLRKVYEFIGLGKWCEAYDNYFNIGFDDLSNVDKLILQAPYEIFQYFLANHYDVFSLIPNNLAIDINTI